MMRAGLRALAAEIRRHPLLAALTALCAISLSVPLWLSQVLPQVELPQHLAFAEILRDMAFADSPYHEYFLAPEPWQPGTLYLWLSTGLSHFLCPELAHRLLMNLYVLALPLSLALLLSAFGRPRRLALFGALLVYNAPFRDGAGDFLLALPVFLLALAQTQRSLERTTARRVGLLALLGLLLYLANLQLYLLLLPCALALGLLRWPGLVRGGLVLAAPALAATLLLPTLLLPGDGAEASALWSAARHLSPEQTMSRFYLGLLAWFRDTGDEWILLGTLTLMSVGLILRGHPAALPPGAASPGLSWRHRYPVELLGLLVGASVFLLPVRLPSGLPIAERHIVVLALLAVPWLGWFRARGAGAAYALAITALIVLQDGYVASRFLRFSHETTDLRSLVAQAKTGGHLSALVPDSVNSPTTHGPVLQNLHHLHATQAGGLTELPLAQRPEAALRFRPGTAPPALPERPGPDSRAWRHYEHLLVHREATSRIRGLSDWLREHGHAGDWTLHTRRRRPFQAWWALDDLRPEPDVLARARKRIERARERSAPEAPRQIPHADRPRDKHTLAPIRD